MLTAPSKTYLTLINSYDSLYKNQLLSYYQIPKVNVLTISFFGNNLQLKYIIYSLIFFLIKTLQQPYLLFKKELKVTFLTRQSSFIGGKVKLRKKNLYRFLTEFQLYLYPKLCKNKPVKHLNLQLKNWTVHLTNLVQGFPELEIFYLFFQQITTMAITFEMSQKQDMGHLLSQLNMPIEICRQSSENSDTK